MLQLMCFSTLLKVVSIFELLQKQLSEKIESIPRAFSEALGFLSVSSFETLLLQVTTVRALIVYATTTTRIRTLLVRHIFPDAVVECGFLDLQLVSGLVNHFLCFQIANHMDACAMKEVL